MRRPRAKPSYALLAGAVLGVIVMPIAFAGAASDPEASTSASVKKQLKKLKQQVNQLQEQLQQLGTQPGPPGPPVRRGSRVPRVRPGRPPGQRAAT
jgi:hypothetical protein